MKNSPELNDVARALSAALEPLIDVCLKIGVTSPEIESLLRVAFVQRAFLKLPRHSRTGRGPSDSKVSLAAGVHRSEVSKIRGAGGTASAKGSMAKKKILYSKSARILSGWSTDARFLTSSGAPMDLPLERNRQRRSFEDLLDKYAPGNHPGSVLKELRRRRNVELLDGDIIRFKGAAPRMTGVNKTSVALAATRMKRLGEALFNALLEGDRARLYAETKSMKLSGKQLARIMSDFDQRAHAFLGSLETEFDDLGVADDPGEVKRLGVSVFVWEDEPKGL